MTCTPPWSWTVRVSPELTGTPPPSAEELRLMREVLDPDGRYTR